MKNELNLKGFSAITENEVLEVNGGFCFIDFMSIIVFVTAAIIIISQ